MSCDVMLFFEWFYVSKVIQNRFQISPKSLPNPPQIGPKSCPKRSAAINGDPKRPKVISPNDGQRFLVDDGTLLGAKNCKKIVFEGLAKQVVCEVGFLSDRFWMVFGPVLGYFL